MAGNDNSMLGVWLERGGLSLRDDLPVPRPASGEALIRVLRAGICATDLQLVGGYARFDGILGHEFVGHVVEGPPSLRDRRVVGEVNVTCGQCERCVEGRPRHCLHREVLGIRRRHGAFAQYLTLPTANLHVVPDSVSDDEAVFIEPLAAALRITQQLDLGPADRVLVVGDGKLGQLIARALVPSGCQLTVLGRHANKLELLRAIGIETLLENPGPGFSVAIDCAGGPDGFQTARACLRAEGTLVLKSTYAGQLALDASSLVVDEILILGSRCGPFEPAIAMLAGDTLDLRPLIEARYPLAQALEALAHARRRGALKVLLTSD